MSKEQLSKKNPNLKVRARRAAATTAMLAAAALAAACAPGDAKANDDHRTRPTTTAETTTSTLPEEKQPVKQERARDYVHGQMQQIIGRLTAKIGEGDLRAPEEVAGLSGAKRRDISDAKQQELGLEYGAVSTGSVDVQSGDIQTMFSLSQAGSSNDLMVTIFAPAGPDGKQDLSKARSVFVSSYDSEGSRSVNYFIHDTGSVTISDNTSYKPMGSDDEAIRSSRTLSVYDTFSQLDTGSEVSNGLSADTSVTNDGFDQFAFDSAKWVNSMLAATKL